MKKGPLSNKEKKHITKHRSREIGEIATEMDRSESIVQKFVATLEEPKEGASSLFARNEEYGVTVMTESASMASDAKRADNKDKEPQTPARYHQFIHKIKDKK
jgi:hypothetical protein|tara:strand:- start:9295 stop:9603 length:309 start_codon:yes stop_codon:yes gene_type:complete